jgi:hypothetical protein
MAEEAFGSDLWKSAQSIKFGKDGEIGAPVRVNGRDGIVVGFDQVAAAEAAHHQAKPAPPPGRFARWRARFPHP